MTNELREGPVEAPHSPLALVREASTRSPAAPVQAAPAEAVADEPASAAPVAYKLTWREKRYLRRRRRIWFEEILGWILVPVILYACYWSLEQGLAAIGMTPASLIEGLNAIIAHF